jgi:phage host-nuclease inhibitor protein Gam
MYSQEKDMALKNIDDELNAYKKATDERLKLIDNQENNNSYSKDLAGKQKELQDIQKQIDKLRLDDSLGAKAKLADLLKQQADKQLELDDFMHQREVDLQKQAIQDEATAREDAANQQKDQMTKYYDDLINSERNFANMREQIMQGNISSLQVDLQNFATFVQQNMATIGQSISENLLDKLAAAGISLSSLNGNGVTFNTPTSVMHNLLGFDTGGFTGNGQGIAMLHEKELILNKDDTSNFLAGIKILRPIVDFLKNPSLPEIKPTMPTGSLPPISINIENLSVTGGKQGVDDFFSAINNKFAARGVNTRV